MLPARAGVDPGSRISSLVQDTCSRLVARAGELAEAGRVDANEVEAKLRIFAECVQKILRGRDAAEAVAGIVINRKDVRLIHAFRAEALRREEASSSAAEVLAVVRAVEELLSAVTEEDPEDLEDLMSRPDAFDLLVEVAHDLRSPLTSILFLSETLRERHSGELNDLQHSQLGLIYSAALGLVSITSDVLDLARQEEWWVEQGAEAYSVHGLLQGVEEIVGPMADEKGIDLILSPPHYDRAYGHPMALSRVLLNLTTNAIKFTDKGFVEVGAKRVGRRRMEYYVRDTGRGISTEMQKEIFRPMKERQTREGMFFSGSGLGLSIARRILRVLGSDLQLESAPDWGTRFFFLVDVPPLA